ncbi:hypothetical protein STITCH_17 [Bacillus phage Stitch]|uniref:Uncharacterized protein n=1 Tax=Bacillus phage Stitch TaxID=1874002 RepID=A0A1B1PAM3_9CAUD|nr:hypothetical protein BIZ85_gp17 [Bacillus phage Stitch]ANT41216.1 hypothetical protein STITCH_17 [Bacillus phage Stitch]
MVDIFFDCGVLQVLEIETEKIAKENNYDPGELAKHVMWMIEDLN